MKTFDLPTTYASANNTMIVKAATILIPTLLGLASLGILFLRRRKNQNGWLSRKSVPLNDKSNFFRLTRLLLDFGGNVLRDFLSREMQKKYPNDFDPTSGNMRGVLTKVQSILCNMPKKIFNDSQRKFCYPGGTPATNVFLDDIDITLAGVLLRNITTLSPNSSKWSKPSATDTDPIALLSRFRTHRNIFHGHASNAAIETTPFLKLFHEIKDLLLGLSTIYSKADYLSLLEEPLDSNLVTKNSELFERWIHVQNMPIEEVEHRLSDSIVKELRYLRETTNNGFERLSQLLNGAGNQLLPPSSVQAGGVPKTVETPTTRGVPTSGETPTTGDVPTTGETPTTGDVPTTGETPTTGDVPTTGETPTTGDVQTTGETPATGGVQTTGETPTTGVVPTTGETPSIKDLTNENHTNIEFKAIEEKPNARDIPTNSTTEVIYKREKYSPAESSPFFRAIEVLHTDNVIKAEAEEACEVEIKPCTDEFYETFANDPDVYSNTSTPRGRAVVINNEMYSCGNLRNRTGTDADSETLQNLLYQLQYRVQVHHDLSSEQIHRLLERESKRDVHKKYDSFILIILTHGTKEGMYGTDGNLVPYDVIKQYFNNANCEGLRGKPKIVIIQSCLGKLMDEGVPLKQLDALPASLPHIEEKWQQISVADGHPTLEENKEKDSLLCVTEERRDADSQRGEPLDEKLPTMADFLVAYATTPDYVAMRDTKTGTWFIQGIASVFAKYACTEDAVSLFGKVNAHIAKRQTRGLGIKQVSSFESTLLKKVYFFPGR